MPTRAMRVRAICRRLRLGLGLLAFGLPPAGAVILGGALALSSTAVVAPSAPEAHS